MIYPEKFTFSINLALSTYANEITMYLYTTVLKNNF